MKRFCCILLCVTAILLLSACADPDWVILSQTGNHSAGDWWDYELSNDTVIREMDYTESQLVPVSPGYQQHWKFEIIGEGDVTIYWQAYKGDHFSEKHSYSVTYHFDENGNYTVLSES